MRRHDTRAVGLGRMSCRFTVGIGQSDMTRKQEIGGDLFGMPVIEGFSYVPDIFSPSEEAGFVRRFEALPFQPFQFFGHLGNRRIVSYGFRYDYSQHALLPASPMPEFILALRNIASTFSRIPVHRFQHALVTEYAAGAGIGWHKDRPVFQDVVALSFVSPCVLRFRRRSETGWFRQSVGIAQRSGYLLQGEAREVWQHSILPMSVPRYSVTFRTFRGG
jgi:hypothetical protein